MIKKVIFSCAIIFTISSPSIWANETIKTCEEKSKTQVKLARCLDAEQIKLDRELETWVNNHVLLIKDTIYKTGRKSILKSFNRAQNNFLDYRENHCRWIYLQELPLPTASVLHKKCMVEMTQNRIDVLSVVE